MITPIKPVMISGKVIKGEAVGRTIGFPTANLALAKPPKFKHGVYAALVTLNRQNYLGLAYFGPRYIFGQKNDNFEVYIFNFDQAIYGRKLTVKLLKFLRAPQSVRRLDQLRRLLERDVARLKNDVVLVDKNDRPVGIEAKGFAHRGSGKLHRAFSVYIFNQKRELLLQQRSRFKDLWPLYWANSCCSHPYPGEDYLTAATRRLQEELGLSVKLKIVGSFIYRASDTGRGSEYERDTVLVGITDLKPRINKKEVAAWRYAAVDDLPGNLVPWLKLGLKKIHLSDIFKS